MSEPAASFTGVIERGGVVLFAADTVYGLCCDAQDRAAVERLYALKGRQPEKPAAVAFFALDAALRALPELGPRSATAVRALLPGPVTLLLPNPQRRFPLAGGTLLGVRVIDVGIEHPGAVLQSSANIAGGPDARTLAQVPDAIRAGADLVIDAGELPGTPSTVIDLGEYETRGRWRVVRPGALAEHAVAAALLRSDDR